MNHQNNKSLLKVILLLTFIWILITTNIACEGKLPVRIQNQTNQTLTIFINEQMIGDAKPSEEIMNKYLSATYREYLIEAKTVEGGVIYSRKYTFDELSRDLDWKVVIPMPQK